MTDETTSTEQNRVAADCPNERLVIRMELFKEVYLQWCPEIKRYTGNVASEHARNAVAAFDEQFGV